MRLWPSLHGTLRLWIVILAVAAPFVAYAKDRTAIFVQSLEPKNSNAQKTSGEINWLLRALSRASLADKGEALLDRGLFFSNAEALAAGSWLRRAQTALNEGMQNYASDPSAALEPLLKASRFLEYTFAYFPVIEQMRVSRLASGLLYWRKGEKAAGMKMMQTGILLDPKSAEMPEAFSDAEKEMIAAVRCKLSTQRTSTLTIQAFDPRTELYLNDKFVGLGKVDLKDLRPGEYMIKTMLDGYRHYKRKFLLGKSGRVFARNRPGPRIHFYEELCKKFPSISNDEQLKDELKAAASTLRLKKDHVTRFLVGCFQPSGNGNVGTLKWFALEGDKMQKGSWSVPPSTKARIRGLNKLVSALGLQASSQEPSMSQYASLAPQDGCKEPNNIELPPLMPPKSDPPMWTVSPGDAITLSTHHGFRLQGTVVAIDGETLTLEVSKNKSDPAVLRQVKIQRKEVKWTFILGPKQEGGFRIGERLIVISVFGLVIHGVLASDDGEKMRLQTKHGSEVIPWSMIRRVIRRDS